MPRYVPAVPTDPLAAGSKPLGYVNAQTDPARPRVYGVGENGTDQGGNEPDPRLSRNEYIRLADQVRHLRHQARQRPKTRAAVQGDAKLRHHEMK